MANTACWDKLQNDYSMGLLDCAGAASSQVYEQMPITANLHTIEQMLGDEGHLQADHAINPVLLIHVGGGGAPSFKMRPVYLASPTVRAMPVNF